MPRPKKDVFVKYDILLRLSGSRNNEVRKTNLTAPEVMLLGAIHGPDSLAEIKKSEKGKPDSYTDREERMRLAAKYEGRSAARAGFVAKVFGPSTIPLPRELDDGYEPEEAIDTQTIPSSLDEVIEPHAAIMG